MRMNVAVALALGVFTGGVASAHEGHPHKLMGTVTAVHAETNHVEVKTKDGKVSGFYVTPNTKYLADGKAAAFGDLAVGARVVATTKMEREKAIATEVKIGDAGSGKDAAPKAGHQH